MSRLAGADVVQDGRYSQVGSSRQGTVFAGSHVQTGGVQTLCRMADTVKLALAGREPYSQAVMCRLAGRRRCAGWQTQSSWL
jgi:hypothetical protein